MIMKTKFRNLIADIDAIADKELAYEQIKQKIWPMASNKKPSGYFEIGDTEDVDEQKASTNRQNTMEMNHYIKSYLSLLINS